MTAGHARTIAAMTVNVTASNGNVIDLNLELSLLVGAEGLEPPTPSL